MTLKDLSDGLRDLAGDVQTVDLHDRAIRTSRRLRARRAAGVMTASLALVLVVVIGVSLSWHGTGPGGGMDTADQAVVDATDSASAYSGSPESPLQAIGRVGYYVAQGGTPDVYSVYSWEPGTDPRVEISGELTFASSVAISPDGRYAAYYDQDRMAVADLSAAEPAGPADVVYEAKAAGDECLTPAWTQDSMSVVLSAQGAKASTLVDLSGPQPVESNLYRPEGCDARLFTYDADSYAFTYVNDANEVAWEDADDGMELTPAMTYPADDIGFLPTRLAGASADGRLVCLSEAVDVEVLPARPACGAFATPTRLVDAKMPLSGVLESAAFLNAPFVPAGDGTGDDPDGSIEITSTSVQDVMLRMRVPDEGIVVAQASYSVEEGDPDEFGDVSVVDFELVRTAVPEPVALADAYLLSFAP